MKKKTAIIAASAAAAAAVFYAVSMGTVIFYSSMVKDRRGDRNYAEGTESAKEPPEKATEYRKSAYPYNKWWSEQPTQERHILSRDGLKLEAKLLKADRETDRLAIVVHGHRCCSGEEGYICKMFHDEGYHVLAIEQRAHGVSEGTCIGFGYREKDDGIVLAVPYLDGICYSLRRGGPLYCLGSPEDPAGVRWYAETGELAPLAGKRRYLSRLQLTAKLEVGSELRVYLSCDGGPWEFKGEYRGNDLHSQTFPIWPRRADSVRLRLEGAGGMELYRISCLIEQGSDE